MQNNERAGSPAEIGANPTGISEMAIVDTFTKLIFGEDREYTDQEIQIIDAFSLAEFGVPSRDPSVLGAMLRELGVRQMIDLVVRVRDVLSMQASVVPGQTTGSGDSASQVVTH